MWNWLRSIGSWFSARPDPVVESAHGLHPSRGSSTTSKRARRTAPPSNPDQPVDLDWQPLNQPAFEDTVAPPLSIGASDHSPILGIDLGTSWSVVAVMRQGKVEIIPNQEGDYRTPSVVAFTREGKVLVGSPALRHAVLNPQRTVYAIKRHLGRHLVRNKATYEIVEHPEGARVRVDGGLFTPTEISALILRQLLASAEAYLGGPVRRAVLTVPAAFDDAQRQSTLDAALLAGLDVQWVMEKTASGAGVLMRMRVITEPTAAALSLGIPRASRYVAVLHMGGGTCDAAILDSGEGVIKVMAVSGDTTLGGQNFDQVLIDWFTEEFRSRHGVDPRRDLTARWRLQEAAEQAKKDLSHQNTVRVEVPCLLEGDNGPLDLDLVVHRTDLERRTAPLIEAFRKMIQGSLEDARLQPAQIGDVLIVGGMMRMPRLRQLVREIFGRKPNGAVHPEEAVARGAAIHGAELLRGRLGDIVLVDVTPVTLGVEVAEGVFLEMIPRNTSIPCTRTQVFTTRMNAQIGVSIRIFQGDDPIASRNQLLAQFDFDDFNPAPAGLPRIKVAFSLDHNGVLWVTAQDQNWKRKKTIRVARGRRLTPTEANDLRGQAERNAAQRAQQDPLILGRSRAQACLDRLARLLQSQPRLDSTGVARLRALETQVRQKMLEDDTQSLDRAVAAFELGLEALGDWLNRPVNQQSRTMDDVSRQINMEL
jgi:molecular chaperone DnaK